MKNVSDNTDFNTYSNVLMAAMFDDTLEEADLPDTPKNRELLREALRFIDDAEESGYVVDFPY